ncbi:MAG: glycoside hydrolase family 68 protein [Planctomycetes bacterium]|nr:glycoside hydrolase family 68 protein [Planctomycetota bacterium]
MDRRMGRNINGPSLIRAPEWLPNPLGRYYLYFGRHQGDYIRLAYADRLEGPWRTHEPGTLPLAESFCHGHLASPDVHVDEARREIRMYYHGPSPGKGQVSRVALSSDGIRFAARPEILGASYFRVFQWRGQHYALGMPGIFYKSADGLSGFQQGPKLFTDDMRHTALKLDGDTLTVFYSNAHDCPERILMSTIQLVPDWMAWKASEPVTVLEPETDYEGADLPLLPSKRGWAPERVRQLRDPAIYREGGKTYLLYSVAGEHGIAIAEVTDEG